MKRDPFNVVIAGVGGQGNILASRVLAETAIADGYYATIGEIFGASQRGGAVSSHVRLSRKMNYAPLIPGGHAHVILAFEPLEALRVTRLYANENSIAIVNPRKTYPIGVLTGAFTYPPDEQWHGELFDLVSSVHIIPATDMAIEAGNSQATNMVMVGALVGSGVVDILPEHFIDCLSGLFGGEKSEVNIAAFNAGYEHMKKLSGR
jgi:indolepyruvate ferredoxin oxidoreductase, beta subunit